MTKRWIDAVTTESYWEKIYKTYTSQRRIQRNKFDDTIGGASNKTHKIGTYTNIGLERHLE